MFERKPKHLETVSIKTKKSFNVLDFDRKHYTLLDRERMSRVVTLNHLLKNMYKNHGHTDVSIESNGGFGEIHITFKRKKFREYFDSKEDQNKYEHELDIFRDDYDDWITVFTGLWLKLHPHSSIPSFNTVGFGHVYDVGIHSIPKVVDIIDLTTKMYKMYTTDVHRLSIERVIEVNAALIKNSGRKDLQALLVGNE